MSRSRASAGLLALAMAGLAPAAQAARTETGWVQFDLRVDDDRTYVYPRLSNGSWSFVFSGNCQFNALVLADSNDSPLYGMLRTAQEQSLRVSLAYDDADGPLCRLAHLYIEWAD